MNRYEISWAKRGERDSEEPLVVEASEYRDEGDFIDFIIGDGAFVSSTPWRVRASDVRQIRLMNE